MDTFDTDNLIPAACEACNSIFLLATMPTSGNCPYCGQVALDALDDIDAITSHTQPPELTLAFAVEDAAIKQRLKAFSKRFWFAPSDMTLSHLQARLQPLFLPMWLVDSDVAAQWQAEMGFDYDVVSHREKYVNGRWQTQEITKTQIRWEPRVGTLERRYDNHVAPALEEHAELRQKLGNFKIKHARPFSPKDIEGCAVRLPNRATDDAWPEAEASIKTAVSDQCRQASSAEHIREFKWAGQFSNKEWTQLLLPIYTTYYQDDNGRFHPIYLHGQSGKLHGTRRASPRKAKRWSIVIAIIALLTLCLSMIVGAVGLAEESILPFALIFLLGAMGLGITAVIPQIIVWYINNKAGEQGR